MPSSTTDELAELEALMANACDAEGNDKYVAEWTARLTDEERKASEANLRRSIEEARASLLNK